MFGSEDGFEILDCVGDWWADPGSGWDVAGVNDATHGQHNRQRHPGSIGAASYPARVFKGMRMAGQMGNARVKVEKSSNSKIIATPLKNQSSGVLTSMFLSNGLAICPSGTDILNKGQEIDVEMFGWNEEISEIIN